MLERVNLACFNVSMLLVKDKQKKRVEFTPELLNSTQIAEFSVWNEEAIF